MKRREFLAATLGSGLSRPLAAVRLEPEFPGRTRHTRFSVNVQMWWTRLPFIERVYRAAALGFPAVEFWPWQDKDIDRLADVVGRLGIAVSGFTAWGFNPPLNNPLHHDAFVSRIEQAVEVAHRLGVRGMTVVGGDDQPGMAQEEMHDHIVTALKRAAPIAEDADVTLLLEPMNIRVDHQGHSLFGSPPAIRICQRVDSSHVKINWDLYHMHITEGDLIGRLNEGFDHIGYVQLADHPGRFEPGTGEIHYAPVLRALHELGYRGFVGLECRPRDGELAAARRVAAADDW